MKVLRTPLEKKTIAALRCGEEIVLSGTLYTARDQAHKRFAALIKQGKKLPIDLRGQMIYYCGPNPPAPGNVIGSCGPTTAGRMDLFTPLLLERGLLGMVGKGDRSAAVVEAIKKFHVVYCTTFAGCGALLAQFVKQNRCICFHDLGAEAVFALEVERFPLIVAVDSEGRTLYEQRRQPKA